MWAHVRAWFTDNHREMLLRISPGRWQSEAVDAAHSILGWGEEGANNQGPDLDILRRGRKLKPWQSGSWCATAMSWVIEESWARTQGFSRWDWMTEQRQVLCPIKRTPSALRLANRIAKAGCLVGEGDVAPGDFALWKRSGGHHIGIVVDVRADSFTTIEGNKGRFNRKTKRGSKVRKFKHEFGEPSFKFFARLP